MIHCMLELSLQVLHLLNASPFFVDATTSSTKILLKLVTILPAISASMVDRAGAYCHSMSQAYGHLALVSGYASS